MQESHMQDFLGTDRTFGSGPPMLDKSRRRGQESISAIIASVERGVGNSHVSTTQANQNKNYAKQSGK